MTPLQRLLTVGELPPLLQLKTKGAEPVADTVITPVHAPKQFTLV
jgi:hypothetical protein